MNGLCFIPIFSVVVVGMTFRRVFAVAAKFALVVGFMPSLAEVVSRMHEFHFLGVVFVALIALMLIMGTICPREEAWEQHYSGDVDLTPWQHVRPVGVALLAVVVLIYIVFADFYVL